MRLHRNENLEYLYALKNEQQSDIHGFTEEF